MCLPHFVQQSKQRSFRSSAVITFALPAALAQDKGFAAAQGRDAPPPGIGPSCCPVEPWKSPVKCIRSTRITQKASKSTIRVRENSKRKYHPSRTTTPKPTM